MKRYKQDWQAQDCDMIEDPEGDWVKFEDAHRLIDEREAKIDALMMEYCFDQLTREPAIEQAAQAIWESETHPLLAQTGRSVAWQSQPRIIKNGCRRSARLAVNTAIGVVRSTAGGTNDSNETE